MLDISNIDTLITSPFQRCAIESRMSRIYALFATLESITLMVACITGLINAAHEDDVIKCTCILGLFATFAFLYFTIDAIAKENNFQFAASIATHILISLFVLWHYFSDTLGNEFHTWADILVSVTCTCQILYFILIPFVVSSFGWRVYKRVGADVSLQHAYKVAHAFFALIKFDFTINVILVILASFFLFESVHDREFIYNAVALVITVVWLIFGYKAVRSESASLLCWLMLSVCEPIYIIYKFVQLNNSSYYKDYPRTTYLQFYIVGGISLGVRMLLIISSIYAYRNFGKGLLGVFHKAGKDDVLEANEKKISLLIEAAKSKRQLEAEGGSLHPSRGRLLSNGSVIDSAYDIDVEGYSLVAGVNFGNIPEQGGDVDVVKKNKQRYSFHNPNGNASLETEGKKGSKRYSFMPNASIASVNSEEQSVVVSPNAKKRYSFMPPTQRDEGEVKPRYSYMPTPGELSVGTPVEIDTELVSETPINLTHTLKHTNTKTNTNTATLTNTPVADNVTINIIPDFAHSSLVPPATVPTVTTSQSHAKTHARKLSKQGDALNLTAHMPTVISPRSMNDDNDDDDDVEDSRWMRQTDRLPGIARGNRDIARRRSKSRNRDANRVQSGYEQIEESLLQ